MRRILINTDHASLKDAIESNSKLKVGKWSGSVKVVVHLNDKDYFLDRKEIAEKFGSASPEQKAWLKEYFKKIEVDVQTQLTCRSRPSHAIRSWIGKWSFDFRKVMSKWPETPSGHSLPAVNPSKSSKKPSIAIPLHFPEFKDAILENNINSQGLKLKFAPSFTIHYCDFSDHLEPEKLKKFVRVDSFYLDREDLARALNLEGVPDNKTISRELMVSCIQIMVENSASKLQDNVAKDLIIARHFKNCRRLFAASEWYKSAIFEGSVEALFEFLRLPERRKYEFYDTHQQVLIDIYREIRQVPLSEEQLCDFMQLALNGSDSSKTLPYTNQERYAVALKICENDPTYFASSYHLENFGLTKEQQFLILKKSVEVGFKIFQSPRDCRLKDDDKAEIFFTIQIMGLEDYHIGLTNLYNFLNWGIPIHGDKDLILSQAMRILLSIDDKAEPSQTIDLLHTFFKTRLKRDVDLNWLKHYVNGKDQFVSSSVLFGYFQIAFYAVCYPPFAKALDFPEIFKEIVKCDTGNRTLMVQKLLQLHLPHNSASLKFWRNLRKEFSGSSHTELPCLLFATFPSGRKNSYLNALNAIKEQRTYYRDSKNQKLLLEFLDRVNNSSLSDESLSQLLVNYFSISGSERAEISRLLADLLSLQGADLITYPLNQMSLKEAIEKQLKVMLNLDVDNYDEKYEQTLGKWRNNSALMTWIGRLQHLLPKERNAANTYLKTFLKLVLEGTFSEERMKIENPHLTSIFADHPSLKESWTTGISLETSEIVSPSEENEESPQKQIFKFLTVAFLQEQHLGGIEQESIYPHLTAFLKNGTDRSESIHAVEEKIQTMEKSVQNNLSMKQRKRALNELKNDSTYKALTIEKYALQLLDPALELHSLTNNVNEIVKRLPPNNAFRNGLKELAGTFQQNQESPLESEWRVFETDDPNHIVLMGTEVEDSCQRVDGQARLNVCILGYALDAKHRLALVTKPDGTILGRSVLRLLQDKNGNPVLFQERLYIGSKDPAIPSLVRKLALKKARSMGVPLLFSKGQFESDKGIEYPLEIFADTKPIEFEYVDALVKIEKGPYSIYNALQEPSTITEPES